MSAQGGAMGIGTASDEVQDLTARQIEKDGWDHNTASSDPSVVAEKGEMIDIDEQPEEEDTIFLSHEVQFPIDPDAELEEHQFTFRAVFVGCCLGGVIAASKYDDNSLM